jgi:L-2-hydroxyglutarate oxidase LhgO
VTFMTSSGLRAWEPNLRACCGIIIPNVSVIDAHAFVHSLRTDAEANGVEFAFNNQVVGIEADATDYIVTTDRQRIRAACLINAAGLHADEIAALAPHTRNYSIHPLRGEYYEVLTANKKALTGRLVYPALPSHAAGKGIHFSPRPDGRLFVGPNAVRVEDKTDYTSGKTPPGLFVEALQKFLPALEERDLRWAYSGIRPCVIAGNGGKSDFIIAADCEDPPLINLVGIESPGLSAALAIARHVRELSCLQRHLKSLRP